MNELELKLGVSPAALPEVIHALTARGARRVRLEATYYDTADGLLGRHQVVLRLRREGDEWVQTVKAPGRSAAHRLEHEIVLDPPPEGTAPSIDLARHDGSEAGAALREVLKAAGDAPALARRQGTQIERQHCTVQVAPDTVVELALDTGFVTFGDQRARVTELECEHKRGAVHGLFDVAREWLASDGLWLGTITKAQRGERLMRGEGPVAVKADALRYDKRANGRTVLQAVLASVLSQVLANASEVAEGSQDEDVVHQLRVGLRRLRTALRELAMFSDAIAPSWAPALSEAFTRLGELRDRQAVTVAVEPLLARAGLTPGALPAPAPIDVAAVVKAPAFQLALLGMLELVHADVADDAASAPGAKATRKALARRLQALHRKVQRRGPRFDTLAPDAQHRVRKQLKRLRYLAEFAAPLWPRKDVDRYLKRLRPMQDVLGLHNDVVVAAGLYRDESDGSPGFRQAAELLHAHLPSSGKDARRALKKLRNSDRFWVG